MALEVQAAYEVWVALEVQAAYEVWVALEVQAAYEVWVALEVQAVSHNVGQRENKFCREACIGSASIFSLEASYRGAVGGNR